MMFQFPSSLYGAITQETGIHGEKDVNAKESYELYFLHYSRSPQK